MASRRGGGSRGVVAQIDARLAELDVELARASELLAERRRLLAARASLTGEQAPAADSLVRRISREEISAYLVGHPGARPSQIARDLGVALTTVSQHLHRGRDTRFERRDGGWYALGQVNEEVSE